MGEFIDVNENEWKSNHCDMLIQFYANEVFMDFEFQIIVGLKLSVIFMIRD
jgi:hypothetical protein